MRAPVTRLLLYPSDHARLYGRCGNPWFASFMLSLQTGDPGFFKATLPQRHRPGARAQFALDFPITQAIGQAQDQARPEHLARRKRPRLCPAFQFLALLLGDLQQISIISHFMRRSTYTLCITGTGH